MIHRQVEIGSHRHNCPLCDFLSFRCRRRGCEAQVDALCSTCEMYQYGDPPSCTTPRGDDEAGDWPTYEDAS